MATQIKSKSYIGDGKGGVSLIEEIINEPSGSKILVKIKCFGLNRADILQAKGLYSPPSDASNVIGLEFSGEVFQVANTNSKLKVGDRVCGLTSSGAFSEYILIEESLLIGIDQSITFEKAATVPEAWATAYFNLENLNKISAGDLVLIHSGAGSVGMAAIQLAAHRGAEVIACVGTDEKVNILEKSFDVKAFNYKKSGYDFLSSEYNSQVAFVLDTVGPNLFTFHTNILKPRGHIQTIGLLGGNSGVLEFGPFLRKNLTISTSTLRSQDLAEKATLCRKLETEILPLITEGKFNLPVYKVLDAREIDQGFKMMLSNEVIGKIVFSWD